MCINGLKIQLIIMLKHLALGSFLLVLGTVAVSCLWAGFCPCLALAVLPEQLRHDEKRSRVMIKRASLESFEVSWEREIAEAKQQNRKRKFDFLKYIN